MKRLLCILLLASITSASFGQSVTAVRDTIDSRFQSLYKYPFPTIVDRAAAVKYVVNWSNSRFATKDTLSNFATQADLAGVSGAGVTLGESSSTAYRGDRGKIAYDHTFLITNPHSVTKAQVGLGNVDNTSDANKPVSTATTTALGLKVDKDGTKVLSTNDYTTPEKTKLSGIATGATANSSDATLLNRANHTGTQLAATISDFATAVSGNSAVAANTAKQANANHSGEVTGSGALTITNGVVTNAKLANVATSTFKGRSTAGTGVPEDLTLAQARTLLNVADGATANSSDATLLNRANHTGTQAISTVTGLQAALDAKLSSGDFTKIANAIGTISDLTTTGIRALNFSPTSWPGGVQPVYYNTTLSSLSLLIRHYGC